MTTLTSFAGAPRIDSFFAAVIGFCAEFCGGARQGGYPPSTPSAPMGRRR